MRHVFILNPHSGSYDRSAEMSEKIHDAMRARGEPYSIHKTQYPQHAIVLAQDAAASGEPVRLYACGGDGTLNEVASGAAGYENAAITSMPIGSGNDFIRIFGNDARRFYHLEELLDADCTPFDLIDCNGRYALNICSVGFDARVGLGVAQYRRSPATTGEQAYRKSLVSNFLKGINQQLDVYIQGQEFLGKRVLVTVLNGRYYGGGFNPSLTARPDDGEFEILITKKLSPLQVVKMIDKYAAGHAPEIPQYITILRGTELRIVCGRVEPISLDGERLEARELNIRLAEKRVNFFYPKGAKYW